MPSKEEIEEAKERIWKSINNTLFSTLYSQEKNEKDEQILLDYIEQLEQEKHDRIYVNNYENSLISKLQLKERKLIEKLENRIKELKGKSGGNTYHVQSIINAEIRENESILKILKGENHE